MELKDYIAMGGEEPTLITGTGFSQKLPKNCYMVVASKSITALLRSDNVDVAAEKGFTGKDLSEFQYPHIVKGTFRSLSDGQFFYTDITMPAGEFCLAYSK